MPTYRHGRGAHVIMGRRMTLGNAAKAARQVRVEVAERIPEPPPQFGLEWATALPGVHVGVEPERLGDPHGASEQDPRRVTLRPVQPAQDLANKERVRVSLVPVERSIQDSLLCGGTY